MFRPNQPFGLIVCYVDGVLVNPEEADEENAIYVHEKCVNWAPNIYYLDDKVMNLEEEIERGEKLLCSRCAVKGAVLGCSYGPCRRTCDATCALQIDCTWDSVHFKMLCPTHKDEKIDGFIRDDRNDEAIIVKYAKNGSRNEEIDEATEPDHFVSPTGPAAVKFDPSVNMQLASPSSAAPDTNQNAPAAVNILEVAGTKHLGEPSQVRSPSADGAATVLSGRPAVTGVSNAVGSRNARMATDHVLSMVKSYLWYGVDNRLGTKKRFQSLFDRIGT